MLWLSITIGAFVLVGALCMTLTVWQAHRARRAESAPMQAALAAQRARSTALQLDVSLPPMATVLGEEEKIKRLIDAVAAATDITFIRNGEEHTSGDAAAHLNRKYQAAKDKIRTAREYIEHVGSRSSMSGEEYRVRLPDGTEQTSERWLSERLEEIESASRKPSLK